MRLLQLWLLIVFLLECQGRHDHMTMMIFGITGRSSRRSMAAFVAPRSRRCDGCPQQKNDHQRGYHGVFSPRLGQLLPMPLVYHPQPVVVRLFSTLGNDDTSLIPTKNCTRSNPFEWDELYELIVIQKDLAGLCRSRPVEESYIQHRQRLATTHDSIYDYILYSKFGLPRQWNDQTNRWHVPLTTNSNNDKVLVPNDFPYFTAPGIDHWVLWKLGAKVNQEDIDQALETLQRQHNASSDILYWENPPHLKSLPGIDHIHLLAKQRP